MADDELTLRREARDDASVIATIAGGEVRLGAPASDPELQGWMHVLQPTPSGWIRFAEIALHGQLFPVVADETDTGVDVVAAGGSGFVAQMHGAYGATSVASMDGEAWAETDGLALPAPGPWPIAWGPSGWIAATTPDSLSDAWVWESSDGSSWASLGALLIDGRVSVDVLAGSSRGYLMTLTGLDARDAPSIWFSPDGVIWQESADPWPDQASASRLPRVRRARAADGGFVIWQWNARSGNDLRLALSSDNGSWRSMPVDQAEVAWLEVVPLPGALLGLSADQEGTVAAWAGSVTGEDAGLRRSPKGDQVFAGARISAVTSDGERAYAIGYDATSGDARAWVGDASGWRALSTPVAGFGTVVRQAAAGPEGLVVAGQRIGETGATPVFWHLRQDGSWHAELQPIGDQLNEHVAGGCEPSPTTAIAFAAMRAGTALACYGDRPITFDAWSGDCRACWGRLARWWDGEPSWLAHPQQPLLLMPYEGYPDQGWYRAGILPPDESWRDEWSAAWVTVTGHFDDPACAQSGAPPEPLPPGGRSVDPLTSWQGSDLDRWRCRTAFVVTEVRLITAS